MERRQDQRFQPPDTLTVLDQHTRQPLGTLINLSDGDGGDVCDISDLSSMVDYLFFSGTISNCFDENDINRDLAVDISDLQSLIDFLFFGASHPTCP
jgi:hypothetical protein